MLLLRSFYVNTTEGVDIINIGHELRSTMKEAKMERGGVTITVPHPGAGVVMMAGDEIRGDLRENLKPYLANGVMPSFLARSLVVPVEQGRMIIEPWQEVFLIDYTSSGKRREFKVQLHWEAKECHEPKR